MLATVRASPCTAALGPRRGDAAHVRRLGHRDRCRRRRPAAPAAADHRAAGGRGGRRHARRDRAGLVPSKMDDRDLVPDAEDRDPDQGPPAGQRRRPAQVPCLRRRHRRPRRRPDRPRAGAPRDPGGRGVSRRGRRTAPHAAGVAGSPECREDARREGARHQGGGHRSRTPRRIASLRAAAAPGNEKGLAGTRTTALGGPGPRRHRREKARI